MNEINEQAVATGEQAKQAVKATSMRVFEEDVEFIKAFATANDMNQAETLNALVGVYKMQQAKGLLSDRGREIEIFQSLLNDMASMFSNSLMMNKNAEDRIREEMRDEIKKKDDVHARLNEMINDLKASVEDYKKIMASDAEECKIFSEKTTKELNEAQEVMKKSAKEATKAAAELEKMDGILFDYRKQVEEKTKDLGHIKRMDEEMREDNNRFAGEVLDAKKTITELKEKSANLEMQNTGLREQKEFFEKQVEKAEKNHKEDMAVAEKKYEKALEELKKEIKEAHKSELEALNKKQREDMASTEKTHIDSIDDLRSQLKQAETEAQKAREDLAAVLKK
ncbi:MAG: hypothetical protein JJE17_02800 [Peptostreptococcaceae bacterium]|nr:hypothetical protein [Peptostreptococcaceae bacterium]